MDNHFYYLLGAAVAPVIAGLGYIVAKDRYNKEPVKMLFGAFMCGIISIIPICIVEGILEWILSIFSSQPSPLLYSFWTAFIVAACTEEFFKLYVLYGFIWKIPEFDERFDGIVYGVFVSLGFACAENIMYVLGSLSEGGVFAAYSTSVVRAIFSIPCHFFCGVILGYYLSLAKFEHDKNDVNGQKSAIIKGLFYAIMFHGIYDFILFYNSSCYANMDKEATNSIGTLIPGLGLFIVFIAFNILFWKHGRKRINHLAGLLRPNSKDEPSAFITCSNCGTSYMSDQNVCPHCNQLTEKTILAQNNVNNDLGNQDLHNLNSFVSNHEPGSPNKPY